MTRHGAERQRSPRQIEAHVNRQAAAGEIGFWIDILFGIHGRDFKALLHYEVQNRLLRQGEAGIGPRSQEVPQNLIHVYRKVVNQEADFACRDRLYGMNTFSRQNL